MYIYFLRTNFCKHNFYDICIHKNNGNEQLWELNAAFMFNILIHLI